jgi:hypothetical protein
VAVASGPWVETLFTELELLIPELSPPPPLTHANDAKAKMRKIKSIRNVSFVINILSLIILFSSVQLLLPAVSPIPGELETQHQNITNSFVARFLPEKKERKGGQTELSYNMQVYES